MAGLGGGSFGTFCGSVSSVLHGWAVPWWDGRRTWESLREAGVHAQCPQCLPASELEDVSLALSPGSEDRHLGSLDSGGVLVAGALAWWTVAGDGFSGFWPLGSTPVPRNWYREGGASPRGCVASVCAQASPDPQAPTFRASCLVLFLCVPCTSRP